MAKGDASQQQQPQAPKMDQYSVMHGIMDRLGSMGGSMAPSQISMPGNSGLNIPNSTIPMQPRPSNMGGRPVGNFGSGGQMGGNFGQYAHDFTPMGQGSWNIQPQSIAPGNPSELIRRMMMGNNVA
jgi:hypothetical protein